MSPHLGLKCTVDDAMQVHMDEAASCGRGDEGVELGSGGLGGGEGGGEGGVLGYGGL